MLEISPYLQHALVVFLVCAAFQNIGERISTSTGSGNCIESRPADATTVSQVELQPDKASVSQGRRTKPCIKEKQGTEVMAPSLMTCSKPRWSLKLWLAVESQLCKLATSELGAASEIPSFIGPHRFQCLSPDR